MVDGLHLSPFREHRYPGEALYRITFGQAGRQSLVLVSGFTANELKEERALRKSEE